ncbi:galactosylgalactosylxylosylprotein 3-beta-glucuronosyltransferase P isoform X2 [Aethina tumida]|nr:galactosylgalactosylxylosylprotein 3-beta-glucuronosyltransferase P isoform X2 [Aethina tumida]
MFRNSCLLCTINTIVIICIICITLFHINVSTRNSNPTYRDIDRENIYRDNIQNIESKREKIDTNVRINECLNDGSENLPPLYVITPTYRRSEQLAELTRLSNTLMLVPNLHWLVIEDAYKTNDLITELLERTGIKYEYLTAPMPEQYKKKKGTKPRGVSNRNKGLDWIRENAKTGVFYFADDDNSYDLQLFREIRYTKRVSMFPVGLVTKFGVSTPVIRNGQFIEFYDGWLGGRKFPVDMAGFAVSVQFLLERPQASMPYTPGFEEDGFLKSLKPFEPKEIEFMASNCTKIYVWHTQTKKNEPSSPLADKFNNTNVYLLKQILV